MRVLSINSVPSSDEMAWQQEVRDPLLHRVLMLAIRADKLPRRDRRLEQQCVQVLERLVRLLELVRRVRRRDAERLGVGRRLWEAGQAELCM